MRREGVEVAGAKLSHGLAQSLPKLIRVSLKAQLVLRLLSEHSRGRLHQSAASRSHGCIVGV